MEKIIHHCENIFKGGIRCEIENASKLNPQNELRDKRIFCKALSFQNYFISAIC